MAVVDLHMPRMVGTEFCRKVRVEEAKRAAAVLSSSIGGGEGRRNVGGALEKKDEEGSDGDGDDDDSEEESHSPMKILLHTTSAGSVKSDELEVSTNVCRGQGTNLSIISEPYSVAEPSGTQNLGKRVCLRFVLWVREGKRRGHGRKEKT